MIRKLSIESAYEHDALEFPAQGILTLSTRIIPATLWVDQKADSAIHVG